MGKRGAPARIPEITSFKGVKIDRAWAAAELKAARRLMAEQNRNAERLLREVDALAKSETTDAVRDWMVAAPRATVRLAYAMQTSMRRDPPPPVIDKTSFKTALFSYVNQIVARRGPWTGARFGTDDWIFAAAHLLLSDAEMTLVFGKGSPNTITQKRVRMKRRGWKVW